MMNRIKFDELEPKKMKKWGKGRTDSSVPILPSLSRNDSPTHWGNQSSAYLRKSMEDET